MELNRLQQLLTKPEGPKLDFKAKLTIRTEGEKKDLAKLVSAIANSRGGRGYLIYGVADKTKELLGINPRDFQEEKMQQIISSRCNPPIPIKVDVLFYQEKHLAIITIYRSEQRPHQLRDTGSFFIRRGSTTDTAQRAELASMLQEVGLVFHETTLVHGATVDDLQLNFIHELLPSLKALPEDMQLLNLSSYGFIGRDSDTNRMHPTVGGLLLFGQDVTKFLPHANVKVIINSPYRIFFVTGTIFEIMDQVQQMIIEGTSELTIPLEAFMEALANALVHRDYWELQRNIVVQIKPTWVSIANPGSLIDPVALTNGSPNQPSGQPVRNPWLFQNLITLDPKKRFFRTGLGFKRMQAELPKKVSLKFINYPEKNMFQLGFIVK